MTKPTHEEIRKMADAAVAKLTDEGRLIEAGWMALRGMVIPPDASEVQLTEMRFAFMAGAQHLWASIMSMLDPSAEVTEQDERRMRLIDQELDAFYKETEQHYGKSA